MKNRVYVQLRGDGHVNGTLWVYTAYTSVGTKEHVSTQKFGILR